MAFCTKCGAAADEGAALCPACAAAPQPQAYVPPQAAPADDTQKDINDNKVMAILSYFSLLVLIPWFAAPNSKFARFHARQGMKLLVVWVASWILSFLLSFIKVRGVYGLYSYTPGWVHTINWLISLAITVFAVLGIVKAAQGKFEAPPLLDKIPLFDK